MKKLFSLIAAVLFAGSMMAEEGILFEQTYPGSPSEKVGSYSKSFTLTTNGYTLTYANINNGTKDDSWDAVRSGSKNGASVAKVTSEAIAGKVSKVIVNFTQVQASKTNELYLQVADNAAFTGATKVSQTIAAGAVAFEIATPAENLFYQIVIDQAQGSANGFNRWNKIQFLSPDGGTPIPTAQKVSVAEAIAAGNALDKGATSEQEYEVTGYVVNAEPFNSTYGNQIWWMADDAANSENQEFEAFSCVIKEDGLQVIDGDKIKLTGHISKYEDTKNGNKIIIEIKGGVAEFIEKAAGDHSITPAKVDTITTAQALAIAQALAKPSANGQSTTDTKEYIIGGYAVQVYDQNSDGTWSFFMADKEGAYGTFQASNATTDWEVVKGDYMYLRGHIARRLTNAGKDQYQVYKGTAEHGEPMEIKAVEIDVARAMEIGNALEDNASTGETYRVVGYVAKVQTPFDAEEGVETFFMSDDPEATFGDFQARLVTIADPGAKVGDYVAVVGQITKYVGASGNPTIQIDHGDAVVLAPQGIENITLTEKAQKVVVDGVIYIVRDNKMFNLQGAQVR